MRAAKCLAVFALVFAVSWGGSTALSLSQAPDEILIGGPISLSGKYAQEGQLSYWGAQVAVQWVNDVYGGVSVDGTKVPLRYIYYDDESKKESVTSLVERLITTDGVDFLLAPYSSGLTLGAAPVADRYGAIMNSIGGASDTIFEQGFDYVVQTIGPASRYQVSALDMVHAIDPEATRLAFLFEDSVFARSSMDGAKAHAEELGFDVVFERTYPAEVKDLTPVLSEMAVANPDILIGGGHFADGQLLISQLRQQGISVKAASLLVAPTLPEFSDALGEAADGVIGPAHWENGVTFSRESTPEGWSWIGPSQAGELSDGVDPDYHAACGAAAVLSYVKAIEEAGSVDVDAVRDTMGDLTFMSFYGKWGIDPETGKQVDHDMVLIQWQNGEKRIVWPESAQTAAPLYPMP